MLAFKESRYSGRAWELRRKIRKTDLKFWLITTKNEDVDGSKGIIKRATDIIKDTRLATIKLPVFALIILSPFLANAGMFSFSFFVNNDNVNNQKTGQDPNSQNIYLLQAAVNADPNPAKGGGDISIVDNVALLAETGMGGSLVEVKEREKTSDHISLYEVREGDTLSQIAELYGVSVNTIRWANNLEGSISPGQTLVILPVTGVKHVVKSGGTVEDIAKIYDGDAREIALFNGISVTKELKPGDEILVPNGSLQNEHKNTPTKVAKSSSTSGAVKVGSSGASVSGSYYVWPVQGGIKTQGIHGNNAIDIGAPHGNQIYAAASGTVILSKMSGWNGGYANYIVIKHDNGTQTLYAHNSKNIVVVGQRVAQGEVIGYVGSTGNSTGPHVHFEVRGARMPF